MWRSIFHVFPAAGLHVLWNITGAGECNLHLQTHCHVNLAIDENLADFSQQLD